MHSVSLKKKDRDSGYTDASIGVAADSVMTNSAHLADVIRLTNCKTCKDVEEIVDKEFWRQCWNSSDVKFEQHMKEEDEARIGWEGGAFEDG